MHKSTIVVYCMYRILKFEKVWMEKDEEFVKKLKTFALTPSEINFHRFVIYLSIAFLPFQSHHIVFYFECTTHVV